MVRPLDEADPIWGQVPAEVWEYDYGGRRVNSPRCGGRFQIARPLVGIVSRLTLLERAKLTTWILEQNRFSEPYEWPDVNGETLESLVGSRPMNTSQRVDRLIAFLANKNYRPGQRPQWLFAHDSTPDTVLLIHESMAWTESESEPALYAIRDMLISEGLLETRSQQIIITNSGFTRIDGIRRGGAPTNHVFVAMWFSEEMLRTYDHGIAPAIVAAGYQPRRIDRLEHVNKIDDEIIAEIRRSKFVVADFTCGTTGDGSGIAIPRGGVYYEAGFAQGLGTPVIWCVREDQIGDVHFDTRQFNHITWTTPEELQQKLTNRIGALFGEHQG